MSESRGLRPVAASFDRPGELTSSGGRALRPLQVQTRNRREGVNEEKTHHTGRLPLLIPLGGAGPALAQTVADQGADNAGGSPGLQRQFHDPRRYPGPVGQLVVYARLRRRPAKSAAAQGSDSLSSTTFGVGPDDPTDGGLSDWVWIALLAATVGLLLALLPLARLSPRVGV